VIDQTEQPHAYDSDDGRAQIQRHLQAVRRSAVLGIAIVAGVTLAALGLSLLATPTYRATARLALQTGDSTLNADMVQRQLTTDNDLVTSRRVLRRAATALPGMTVQQLRDRVSSSPSTKANLIEVTATSGEAKAAASIANAVAKAFITERDNAQRAAVAQQRHLLEQQLRRFEQLSASGVQGTSGKRRALARRLDALAVTEATARSDLRLADPASTPTRASSPRPLLTTVLALFASLVIAILVALAREQLTPRANGPREIARVLGVPLLASIPTKRRRRGGRAALTMAAEREGFESLRSAVETATAPDQQKVIVVTSACVGEGKTTVAYRLAKSLVSAGQSVMLVSGDMRQPTLHTCLGLPSTPGLSDLLVRAASQTRAIGSATLARATRTVLPSDPRSCSWATLALLPSGEPPDDPAPLLASDLVSSLFAQIGRTDYEWVLVDAPPLLGTADARVLAGAADGLLLVSRLGSVTLEQLRSERDELDRLEVEALGVVVIGAPVETSAYTRVEPPRRERNKRGAAPAPRRLVGVGNRSD
jgi:Mrp family chromosome partitioning ATPase